MWKPRDTALERLLFPPPELRNGTTYRLRIGLFDRASGERLPISSSDFPLADNDTVALVDEQSLSKK